MNKKTLTVLSDLIAAEVIAFFAYNIKFGFAVPESHGTAFIAMLSVPALFIIFNLFLGVYAEGYIDLDIMGNLFISSALSHAVLLVILVIVRIYVKTIEYSTVILLLSALFIPILCSLVHLLLSNIFYIPREKPRILICGAEKDDAEFFEKNMRFIKKEYSVSGVIGSRIGDIPPIEREGDIFSVIEQYGITKILFGSGVTSAEIERFVYSSSIFSLSLLFIPGAYEKISEWGKVKPLSSVPLFELDTKPVKSFDLLLQRIFDIVISLTALIVFLPFGLLFSFLIAVDSPGPVFFRQVRTGRYGKKYNIIKFRTMFKDAESATGPQWAEENDRRVTKVGRFLRRSGIDEIPQFLNVLIGQMSVVGPRPERPYFIEKHTVLKGIRMLVLPGITGLAQVSGSYDLKPEEKFKYDLYFINHFSMILYFLIIIKTVFIMLTGKGKR